MDRSDRHDEHGRDAIAVIGPGITISGDVSCSTDLQVEGRIKGEIRCGTVLLGESGYIEGTIQADRVRVSGTVDGAIIAGDLAIEPTAHVRGEIAYTRLKVSAGGVIEGNLKQRAAEEPASESASLKLVEPPEPPQPRRVYGE